MANSASVKFDNLQDWLRWQESCHPVAIELGLDRVRTVAQRLNLLAPEAKVVTVAGTNGKGSCVAALEALLMAAGKSVGAYTSPHIQNYNERIRINGSQVSDADLCAAFAQIDAARDTVSLTYFEFGTLAALLLFARQPLDYWLLEVGLGGRLDATNIIDADIAVITSIALDHEEWLGNNREVIGREKAGICRPRGVFVCADPAPPASVIDLSRQLECQSHWMDDAFGYYIEERDQGTVCFYFGGCRGDTQGTRFTLKMSPDTLHLPLPSLAAALHVCALLNSLPPQQRLVEVVESARLGGRMQTFQLGACTLSLDVAHNPAAMAYLAEQLRRSQRLSNRVVIAMMADKDIQSSVLALAPVVSEWYIASLNDIARAAKPEQIAQCLLAAQVDESRVHRCGSVAEAIESALLPVASDEESVLIVGSFYTVAEALAYLEHNRAISVA